VEVTRTLLDAGMDVDQDLGYESPLMRSIYDSNPKVAKLLIDRGADVNIGFGEGGRPLHAAVDVNDPMYLEMLTDAGADLEYWDEFGNTPLQYAARHGKLDALCWLINAGAELNVSDEYGDHVLDVTEDEDCLNALRKAGCCKVEEDEEEEAEDAPSADEPDAEEKVAFLLGKLAESFGVPAAAEPDIWDVLEEGKVSQLKQCLDSFGDVNRLVKKNGQLFSLVAYAVMNTPTPSLAGCINVLKAAGADMNVRLEDGITALHLAAASNNLEAICALLEAGADSNLKDDSGSAPIAYATDVDCIVRL
jgi:ankyrin repeat protein